VVSFLLAFPPVSYARGGGVISLWLYKENNKLRDWKNVFTLHIPPWAPHTYDFVVLTSSTHPRKILLVVLQIGRAKYLSAPLRIHSSSPPIYATCPIHLILLDLIILIILDEQGNVLPVFSESKQALSIFDTAEGSSVVYRNVTTGSVIDREATNVTGISRLRVLCRRRQVPPSYWYLYTELYGVTSQTTLILFAKINWTTLLVLSWCYCWLRFTRCDVVTRRPSAVHTGDSTTAVAREQLCGHVVSPEEREREERSGEVVRDTTFWGETTEHAVMEETFSVRSVPGLYNGD
jgi:hypothetical protein